MKVKYPQMRQMLIDCLHLVADPERTRSVWIDHDPDDGWLRGGWLPAHVLNEIDDCACLDDPSSMLGLTLATESEVELVRALAPFVEAVPVKDTDAATVQGAEWRSMVHPGRALLDAMLLADQQAGT